MALIDCPVCSKRISSEKYLCPFCTKSTKFCPNCKSLSTELKERGAFSRMFGDNDSVHYICRDCNSTFRTGFSDEYTLLDDCRELISGWKTAHYDLLVDHLRIPKNAKTAGIPVYKKSNQDSDNYSSLLDYRSIDFLDYHKIGNIVDTYIWVQSDALHIMPKWIEIPISLSRVDVVMSNIDILDNLYRRVVIPFSDIEYYQIGGEYYRENKISGGGGGGSDIRGAIIGGVVAGGVGAVIGSRKETDSIKSKLVTHDTRETVLCYYKNGNRRSIVFEYENYQVFEDLIPEKNYDIVTETKRKGLTQQIAKHDYTKTIAEQIRELATLKNDGILTEEEFKEKKGELLARM